MDMFCLMKYHNIYDLGDFLRKKKGMIKLVKEEVANSYRSLSIKEIVT